MYYKSAKYTGGCLHGLANGLQWRGLGARVLGDAVAHTGHSVAGGAQSVALTVSVGTRVARPEALEGCPDLRLTADDDKDEDALGGVAEIRDVPEESRATGHPGDHLEDPGHAHYHHELQADLTQRGSEIRRGTRWDFNII